MLREEFTKLASTRDMKSRKVNGNITAITNFLAKMFLTSRTSEIDQSDGENGPLQLSRTFELSNNLFHLLALRPHSLRVVNKTQCKRNAPSRHVNKPTIDNIEAK